MDPQLLRRRDVVDLNQMEHKQQVFAYLIGLVHIDFVCTVFDIFFYDSRRLKVTLKKEEDHQHPLRLKNLQSHLMMNRHQQRKEGEAGPRVLRKKLRLKQRYTDIIPLFINLLVILVQACNGFFVLRALHPLKVEAAADRARTPRRQRRMQHRLKKNKRMTKKMKALTSKMCFISDTLHTFSVICLS